jgi:hypothetical protein
MPNLPNENGASLTNALLRKTEHRMGNPYDAPRQIVATPVKALKAAYDPKYIRPKSAFTTAESSTALIGTWVRALTFFQRNEAGIPPSLAKAHVARDAAVREPMKAKNQIP